MTSLQCDSADFEPTLDLRRMFGGTQTHLGPQFKLGSINVEVIKLQTQRNETCEELAQVLALLIASKGRVEEREWQAMANADTCLQVGVSRARLAELIDDRLKDLGANLLDHQWLSPDNLRQINAALACVTDPGQRLLVCALAADVLKTRDHTAGYDGLVLDHVLASWHLTEAMVSQGSTMNGSEKGKEKEKEKEKRYGSPVVPAVALHPSA